MSKYNSSISKSISFILIFMMLFNFLGVTLVQAVESALINYEKNSFQAKVGELPNNAPKTKIELKSKRSKYSTRYVNPDGSFSEEVYLEPKFYQDPLDKTWKVIDNNLQNSTKAGIIENKANDFITRFTNEVGTCEVVSISKDDNKEVGFIPVAAKKVNGKIKDNSIIYRNIYEDTDIRYTVIGSKIKEDIILNSFTGKNTFSFELKLKGVNVIENESGIITFENSKDGKIWCIEPPFMVDADGKYSEQVNLVLRKDKEKIFIDVVANKTFLEDPSTKYPVIIDPTVNDWDIMRDTFISSDFPDSSYFGLNKMYTGSDPYYYGTMRSFVQFYLPSLPSDSKILTADFNAYQTQVNTTASSIDLHRVTSSWSGSTTWNTQPSIAAIKESTVTSNADNVYWQWDITQLVKDWYNGEHANHGIMLKQQNEDISPFRTFNTVNSGNNTPRLTINYWVDPMGLEDFWGYTKDGINPANGNLVLQVNDVLIPSIGVPINITRTYNSRKATFAGMFGYGWTSDAETQLADAGNGPITLIDGDGTRHIFGEEIGGGYKAHGGIYLDLVKNSNETYTITQSDGAKINFDNNGKISSIVDTNDNQTNYGYTNGKLTSITDSSNRIVTIMYGTNGYVSSINMPEGRTISYEYDLNGNLTKVIDPELKEVSFDYDAEHTLTSIKDQRNITTTIEYDTGSVKKISTPITVDGVQTTSNTSFSYDFNLSVTSVIDGEGKRIDYQYNPNKNIIQITKNPLDAQNNEVTTFEYDNNNNLVKITDANTNADSTRTEAYIYSYDESGNITGMQLPKGQNYSSAYDESNNPISDIDFNGNMNQNTYDDDNNQLESIDTYLQSKAARYLTNGNIEYDTKMISAADNLVTNSSLEDGNNWPDNWSQAVEPGKIATFTWSDDAKLGNKSISISNPTGWAIISSDMIEHIVGTNYVISGYVKTENTTSGAIIKLEFFNSNNEWLGQEFGNALKGTHDWTRIHSIINEIPAGTSKVRASVGLNAGTGAVYFDGIQLEKGSIVSKYNFIDNAGFEKDVDSDNIPDKWTESGNLSPNDGIYTKISSEDDKVYIGNNSFKITGESEKTKYIKQSINISGDSSTKLTLSGWSMQEGANISGGNYTLQVQINYSSNPPEIFANDFDTTSINWQHVAAKIDPKYPFDSIDVYYVFDDQTGTAYFDAMRLEEASSFTSYYYDVNNYENKIIDPLGNEISYVNDSYGNKTKTTDGKGNFYTFEYDKRNLVTKVTDSKNNITQYGYDNAGNRTTITDARNNVTTINYNEYGQPSKIINPLNQSTEFGYYKNGNKAKIIHPNGDEISYTYNAVNRLDGIFYNDVKKWNFEYDPNGNITSATKSETADTTSYTYDINNRLTKVEEGLSNSFEYGYDDNSNVTLLKITAGSATFTNGYTFNSLDKIVGLSRDGAILEKFAYDEQDNLISIARTNSTYTSLKYSDANHLKDITNYDALGEILNSYSYSYDANGNRTSVITNSGIISYQYDELNQLTQETLLDGTIIAYEYDAVGNRTKKIVTNGTSTTTNYTYNDGNELISVDGQVYTYDQNGNLINNQEKTFIYDEENRLIEVKDSTNQTIANITYDSQGKRTSMTTSNGKINYHYSGNKLIYETDSNNNIISEYTYDAVGNPATMTKNSTTFYYHLNGHSDVVALTDANGDIVAEYKYDAWGNIISQTGLMASENPFRYAGYKYDETIGLYYLMARYYDSKIGRFITRDTFYGFDDNPLSLNQYSYTQNNPVMFTDPTGHYSFYISKSFYFGAGSRLSARIRGYITNWGRKGNISYSLYWNITAGGLGIAIGTVVGGGYLYKVTLSWVGRNFYLKELIADVVKWSWLAGYVYKKIIGQVKRFVKWAFRKADNLILRIPYASYSIWRKSIYKRLYWNW
ncbi:DNRLRE domain-containing protein [Vallitalea pronyensis]|uniref:DNRLRE domain-containing protein n=1 Tax=Vallitalea pronyensis TaxID=1348613 RepID=A0A8J8MMD1_9FIRM|nr:DNRLRE domain-containing protein [Vallitalea pronyensis]QUI24512.1 DNRLRE domain-containing protein [Vallitalea pronyensis]